MLAPCRSSRLSKQKAGVTIATIFRVEALACSTQRGISCVYLWKSVARFGLFRGFLINVDGKEGGNTMGYGVKILKVNGNNASVNRTLQRTKAK
jgi:hypothetical protein